MGYRQKSSLSENIYIIRRRAEAFVHGVAYYICRIFPIDKSKIVMWTFEGNGGYGCSPKYVAEELLKRNRKNGTNHKIIWLVNDDSKKFPKGIRKVKNSLWNRAYHLSTAGVWVGNTRTAYGTKKEKASVISKHGTQPCASSRLESTGEISFHKWHISSAQMIQK